MAEIRPVHLFTLCLVVGHLVTSSPVIIDSYVRSSIHLEMATEGRETFGEFQRKRDAFIKEEFSRSLGSDIVLSEAEQRLNHHVMKLKGEAIQNGVTNPGEFIPARHFFETVHEINESPLFKLIEKMPKGGVLHAHDTAICNLDFIVQLSYWDNLWQVTDAGAKQPRFRFSRKKPEGENWLLVKKVRETRGVDAYDAELRKMISLYMENPIGEARDVNAMWERFMEIFATTDGILLYKDAWEAYFLQGLKEFDADGVNYVEIRSILPKVRRKG